MVGRWRTCLLVALAGSVLTLTASAPAGGPPVAAITAGYWHTCALLGGSTVKCWGSNENGQLADATDERHSAVAVSGLSPDIRTVVAGGAHTCALLNAGGIECWGDNEHGQLGIGTTTPREPPRAVAGLAGSALAVGAGAAHTCAVVAGGAVQCWGNNQYLQLGDGTGTSRSAPTPVSGLSTGASAVAAGALHTCALVGGGVVCWGNNEGGQLGDGTTTSRSTPVPVTGLSSGVRAIAAGAAHTCALMESGRVECWGDDEYSQLGDGDDDDTNRSAPVAVAGLPGPVQAIVAGFVDTCALMTTGAVMCWGELFDDTPETVRQLDSGVTAITLSGADTFDDHACAILSAGGAKCWGSNEFGQLGTGTAESLRSTPATVLGLASGVHVMTVKVIGRGTVSGSAIRCSEQCGYERPEGAKLVLTAKAGKRSVFKSWSGGCKGRKRRCTVALGADTTVTARFVSR